MTKQQATVKMNISELDIREIVKHIQLSDVKSYVQEQLYVELDCPSTHKRMVCKVKELLHKLEVLGYIIINWSFIDSDKYLQIIKGINNEN